NKTIKQLAQGFFEAFSLSKKQKALSALHSSLENTGLTQLTAELNEDDFKVWATNYFLQLKSWKEMSVQNVIDKERNKLQIAGVVQGSKYIGSGINLLAPERDRVSGPEATDVTANAIPKSSSIPTSRQMQPVSLPNLSETDDSVEVMENLSISGAAVQV
ncbi:hypothetical protein BGZ79_002023, partial [Entomortierella chlamydospora]